MGEGEGEKCYSQWQNSCDESIEYPHLLSLTCKRAFSLAVLCSYMWLQVGEIIQAVMNAPLP